MKITLIAPNIVTQKADFFGSGIPYMPLTLAYLAGFLRQNNKEIQVIDSFGENPFCITKTDKHFVQGISIKKTVEKISKNTNYIVLSAERLVAHQSLIDIIEEIKSKLKNKKIIVIENTQAVTAYSLRFVYENFFQAGADFVVLGEPEKRVNLLIDNLEKKVDKTHDRLFQSNGNRALVDVVKDNTEKIIALAEEEKGKFIRYLTTAGKIAASISAIGSVVFITALLIVKLLA